MTTIKNGGPAFPVPEVWAGEQPIREGWNGMTLRDYFAAAAMQGIIARGGRANTVSVARLAYEQADDMLRAQRGVA